MIAVIFEFTPARGRFPDYMELVGQLKPEVIRDYSMDGRGQAPADSVAAHG